MILILNGLFLFNLICPFTNKNIKEIIYNSLDWLNFFMKMIFFKKNGKENIIKKNNE